MEFFVNVPRLCTWLFWLLGPILSAYTSAKMVLLQAGPDPAAIGAAMLSVIGAKELMKRYGGEAGGFWQKATYHRL